MILSSSSVIRSMVVAGVMMSMTRSAKVSLLVVLLEQAAHLERWAFGAVAHDRRNDIALRVELPGGDATPCWASGATLATFAGVTLRSWPPRLASARYQLPSVAGTCPRIISSSDEAAAIESHDVEKHVGLSLGV